jgi:hypothetical protein
MSYPKNEYEEEYEDEEEEFEDEGEEEGNFEAQFGEDELDDLGEELVGGIDDQQFEFEEVESQPPRRYTPPPCVMNSRKQCDPFSSQKNSLGNPFARQAPKNNPFSKKPVNFGNKPDFGQPIGFGRPGQNNPFAKQGNPFAQQSNPFAKQKKAFTVTKHDVANCLRYGMGGAAPRNSSLTTIKRTMGRDIDRYGEELPQKVTRNLLAAKRDAGAILNTTGRQRARSFGKVREELSEARESLDYAETKKPWYHKSGKKRSSVYYE